MAHFLRGKQAGVQNDLSAGLDPELFAVDDFARYGINSQISAIAYDPVQSLLAVGTSDTQFGSGQIYVFGQRRVSVVFNFPRKASARFIQFCADKLISVDSKSDICIFSLPKKKLLVSYAPPSLVSSLLTDPSLDYAFIGLQNGDIIAYDLDRESLTPFRIPNLWKEHNPRSRLYPVVSLAFAPRDIGKLLVGYPEGAVTFSFKQNVAQKYFEYEIPPGAPGGDSDVGMSQEPRRPKLTKALWHPTNTFVLTVHEDSSLVFWDPKDGRLVMARTIHDANINEPGATSERRGSQQILTSSKEPIHQIAWCAKENPDDTGLLIAGGHSTTEANRDLTFIDLGPTPNYQTSSWQVLSRHFESPKRHMTLPVPPGADVVDFCLIPRSSPYFAGAHDPIAIIALLSSGELLTMSFPSGHPISPTNMLHVSLSFVHPFVNKISLTPVDRSPWLGLKERRSQGPKFLIGGAEGKKNLKRFEDRTIVSTAHADGTIRIWDAGHDDEIENGEAIQVDLARAVGRVQDVEVTQMSMSGAAGELSVGLKTGEVVIFRWGRNKNFGRDIPTGPNAGPGELTDITLRTDPTLKDGLLPLTLLGMQQGPVTALKHSDVGFVCAGFEGGSLALIDLRGPAVIYSAHISDFVKANKRSSIRKSRTQEGAPAEWPTCIEFGVLTLDGEDYSSICCFVGTNRGNLATFKVLPSSTGAYTASLAGVTSLDDKVISISPIDADKGDPALATGKAVAGLRTGFKLNGVIVTVTPSGCRIFKPATSKGAYKSWDDFLCDSATVVKTEGRGYSLVGLFGDGNVRAYAIPSLKEIGSSRIDHLVDMRRLSEALISPTGNILAWIGPSEVGLLRAWGAGIGLQPSVDQLFNEQALIPSRPTISNLQWISGTQYVSPADMDILIGGPDRPPSKRMLEQMRMDEQERRRAAREGQRPGQASFQTNDEGYLSYMSRQVQERTERLNIMGDSMDRLEENSSSFANDVGKYVQSQKRKMFLGALGSKFGL
ncbi:SNARE-dependent exocytosis protein (Sro7), putative [Paecilomyces variotii No. 5]|uniref:SNARE-dependent exocytosis protein (Sro7), putative n=1 Tax=Byssochlamys spectabilis (strain No. 5 / NBRC 109023) TaxID=1356009 RepID=V5GAM8_BYSSN|nr:SNARE-dependent exocytosis protein (Sro7), putative [Paecilomyces variotii No. 5]